MTDSKQTVVLNLAPTIDQINADRITQVMYNDFELSSYLL